MLALNLRTCTQVYNAFAKFLSSQVVQKGRTVNTNLIGIFAPDHIFWPSPDFLKASKLKQKSDVSLSAETYDELYANQLKSEPKPLDLNFGSIALVCSSSVKTENAFKVLKDIFNHVVQHSNANAFRLKLKGFGVLKINDGTMGTLEFVRQSEDEFLGEDDPEAKKKKKAPQDEAAQLDDIRNFIDGVSYKLSGLGTDGTLSIKSGFISNMSVRTPRSAISM